MIFLKSKSGASSLLQPKTIYFYIFQRTRKFSCENNEKRLVLI